MILLLACAGSPGENEDDLGTPRTDLAGCSSHLVEDDDTTVDDVYDDDGHLAERTLTDDAAVVITYTTTLDDRRRPIRTEIPLDGGEVVWSENTWIENTWKLAGQTRGRDGETYSTTTWDWGRGTVTVTDDALPDCSTEVTMDGLRWTGAETYCPDHIRSEAQVWEDDRVVSITVDELEFDTSITQTFTWDGGLLAGGETHDDEGLVSSYEVTWDCP